MAINAERPASAFLKDPLKYKPENLALTYTNNRMAIALDKRQCFDRPKLKEFADNISKCDEIGKKSSVMVENIVGKDENARYEQFLPFPQCFPEFVCNKIKVWCSEETVRSGKPEFIEEFTTQTANDFPLVLIAEHFEESVVLMRRYLNRSTRGDMYINQNVPIDMDVTALVGSFDLQLYRRYVKVNYALYEHFYKRLRHQIKAEGSDFNEELPHFKEVRKMVSVDQTKWSEELEIRKEDCDLIQKPEIYFVQDIRENQYGSRAI